jgi:hypothetical protein
MSMTRPVAARWIRPREGVFVLAALLLLVGSGLAGDQTDPLPSWTDGASKTAILDFVKRVTMPGGPDFVPPAERIATFDNDGTLWSEQPMYFQLAFTIDRVKALAPKHPEWRENQPFKAVLEGDMKWTTAGPGARLLVLILHTDAEREYAYDRQSPFERLDKALDEALARKRTVVDMKGDWKIIYPAATK